MGNSKSTEVRQASPRATYQDVLDAPPHMVAEIINGVLYTLPRPASPHTLSGSVLGGILNSAFHRGNGGPGGWWILYEPELHFGDDILVPDLAGWRRERMPSYPRVPFFTLAPDWVCEVLSPSTRKLDLDEKAKIYAEAGVGYYWLVDPEASSLEAFGSHGGEWKLIGKLYGDAHISLPPFEAISFRLGDLWPPDAVHKGPPMTVPEPESVGALI